MGYSDRCEFYQKRSKDFDARLRKDRHSLSTLHLGKHYKHWSGLKERVGESEFLPT